ncbi:MAG: TonB-dependent receptor [Bacteroidota bacterium]
MLRKILFIFLYISIPSAAVAQKVTLSGYVRDAKSGEELIGASLAVMESGSGTISNQYGFYSLSLNPGFYTIVCSYVGYAGISKPVSLGENMVFDFELQESSSTLEEVTVTAEGRNANITRLETGTAQLPIQTIRRIPAFMGEVDVIKAIQMLPGVQATSEGSSGFSVRGGTPDQNLILLDEAPVSNASHLMGFFSVFNNDAIKDVKLYKGDIPAYSGGRLSSLLEVRMKEGNNRNVEVTGGIGTISSRLTVEGPLFDKKASFLLSGRRTYADIFLPFAKDPGIRDNSLYFYDLNGKLNFTINENNRLFISAYAGKDVFGNKFASMFFGNSTFTLRWNHLFSKKLFSNFTLISSHYFYNLGTPDSEANAFTWYSSLDDQGIKGDFIYYLTPAHTFKFGISSLYHRIAPGLITAPGDDNSFSETELPENYALENGVYFSGESEFGKIFALRYGLRYSLFSNVGPATVYNYDASYRVTDSLVYSRGDFFNHYGGLEPRIAANLRINGANAIKASYSRTRQYLQMASNSTAGTPLDIWFPASPNVRPQVSDQVSAGYFRNMLDDRIETSLEVYYKKMDNSIDFADHASLLLNPYLEGELRIGKAWSYGVELYAKYTGEKFTGWISYTRSRTQRLFPEINNGVAYVAPFDKPNDISLVASYQVLPRLALSANWVYSTGIPVTFPTGRYEILGNILPVYTGRNEYRLPDYHRLDLSLTLQGKKKPGRKYYQELNLSVYNAYARKNVWTISFVQDSNNPDQTYAEMTYLFSIIPALTYNFNF